MHIAICLFEYFPFGGLQRDCLEIAHACQQRGHEITLFTMEWTGSIPSELNVQIIPSHGLSNHSRCNSFVKAALPRIRSQRFDIVFGFNKMPGLDLYYAGDSCYQERARRKHRWVSPFYRMTPRFRRYVAFEKAVFDRRSNAEIILLSPQQMAVYTTLYGTPSERFHVLPPSICDDRKLLACPEDTRNGVRDELLRPSEDVLLLMVGSQWKNKGFDRAAHAVASLPPQIRCSTRLVAVGETSIAPYARKAKKLGIADRVSLMPPREDIGRYYLGSDLLVHPAHDENTGGVILESMLHGLPVLTTDVCGYATHVTAAQGGVVIPSPFSQTQMNHAVFDLITSPNRQALGTNAKTYVQSLDLYTRPRRVVDLIEARAERKRRATSPA